MQLIRLHPPLNLKSLAISGVISGLTLFSASAVDRVRQVHQNPLEELGFDADQIEATKSGRPFFAPDLAVGIEDGDIFAGKTKKEILKGNAFSVNHPMMDYREFEKNPTPLVGKEKSSFVWTSSNGNSPARRSQTLDGNPEKDRGAKKDSDANRISDFMGKIKKMR